MPIMLCMWICSQCLPSHVMCLIDHAFAHIWILLATSGLFDIDIITINKEKSICLCVIRTGLKYSLFMSFKWTTVGGGAKVWRASCWANLLAIALTWSFACVDVCVICVDLQCWWESEKARGGKQRPIDNQINVRWISQTNQSSHRYHSQISSPAWVSLFCTQNEVGQTVCIYALYLRKQIKYNQ